MIRDIPAEVAARIAGIDREKLNRDFSHGFCRRFVPKAVGRARSFGEPDIAVLIIYQSMRSFGMRAARAGAMTTEIAPVYLAAPDQPTVQVLYCERGHVVLTAEQAERFVPSELGIVHARALYPARAITEHVREQVARWRAGALPDHLLGFVDRASLPVPAP